MNKTTKRVLSVIFAIVMTLSCFSASFGVMAAAAEWIHLEGEATYEPVTIYVNKGAEAMTSGKTYRIAVRYKTSVLTVSGTSVSFSTPSSPERTQPNYYTSNNGSDVLYTTTDYYLASDAGTDFLWQNSALKATSTGTYLVNNGSSAVQMSSSSVTWTSSGGYIYRTISSQTKYIRQKDAGDLQLSTMTSGSNVYLYEKVTVYEKTSTGAGGYYKYNGENSFSVDLDSTFDESTVTDRISVLHKTDLSTPDADCDVLTLEDEEVTFSWNRTVNTAVEGDYTGTVYVDGNAVGTITVTVAAVDELAEAANDPSTSGISNQFSLTSDEDGKMTTDKTVKFRADEFGAFGSYASDEFSVALSALGQTFPTVETEETVEMEKLHPDVVFVIDASGSMRVFTVSGSNTVTRGEATITGLNEAIKELYANDPETRIGIVTFSNDYDSGGIYLPLDKYTLPEGQTDYVTWGGRMVASATAPSGTTSTRYNNLALPVRTTSSATSVTPVRLSNVPSYSISTNSYTWTNPAYSSMTKLTTTADGTTYYAYLTQKLTTEVQAAPQQ